MTANFTGKQGIARQLANYQVRTVDEDGSFEVRVPANTEPAIVNKTIPVEGQGVDLDGTPVHFLLHIQNGLVKELEIYKADASPILRMPPPEDLEIIVLSP